jgi:hypothetical protein
VTSASERGAVGGLEAIPFGLLIFVVATLLIANAWAVVDAKLAVDAAAREAARTYVEGGGGHEGEEAARRAAAEALQGHGRDAERLVLEIALPDGTGFRRCAPVVVRASYEVPAVPLPWIGGFGDGIEVAARHSERVDPFRDGIPGAAQC